MVHCRLICTGYMHCQPYMKLKLKIYHNVNFLVSTSLLWLLVLPQLVPRRW